MTTPKSKAPTDSAGKRKALEWKPSEETIRAVRKKHKIEREAAARLKRYAIGRAKP